MKTQAFFETHPVFHYTEFTQFMEEQGIHRPASWRQQLSYHHKKGRVVHIRKCLYAVKPLSIAEKDFWIDPFLIAGKAMAGSIISHHTALELLDLAYTTFEELTFFNRQPSKPFISYGQRYRPILFPKSLLQQGEERVGTELVLRQGVTITITGLERTIVDILDRPDLAGGWEEIWRSLDHVVRLDPEKLVRYTLLLNNATTVAKVGFFLEQRPKHLAVEPKYIEQLLPYIPKQPHYMNRDNRHGGKYFEKWQLIVPLEIIEKQWEEPDVTDIERKFTSRGKE